jgi:hypothetical protein
LKADVDILRYDPMTGDADFAYLPLADRIQRLMDHARSEGFRAGYVEAAARVAESEAAARPVVHGRRCPCTPCRAQDWDDPNIGPETKESS